tara:strand:- start:2054 stop:2980 length:927 start_codon:yes stop_codon:yes gene_type:complete
MNEVLIYSDIYSYTAEAFINAINAVESDSLVVRMDTNGGDPQAAFGMVAKFNEFEGEKLLKVDGRANSSGFFFVAMVENVEALEVSEFIVHRAAYSEFIESSEYFTDELKANLKTINDHLKKAFEKKVDIEAFEKIAGVNIKEIFSMDSRIDVKLTAKQAKQIGLIKKINKLTPEMTALIDSKKFEVAANYKPKPENKKEEQPKVEKKMTKEEFKKDHPEAYASVVAEGVEKKEAQIVKENEAIEAKRVERELIKAEVMAEIEAKKANPGETLEKESAPTVVVDVVIDAKKSDLEILDAKIKKELGIK